MLISRDIDPRMRRVIEALAASVESGRPAVPAIPLDLAFVLDSVTGVRGAPRKGFGGFLTADFVLPARDSDERCLVLARVKYLGAFGERNPSAYARLVTDPVRMRLLGPCAFYERFGQPGPGIERWLRSRDWNLGLVSAWDMPFPRWTPRNFWYDSWRSSSLFADLALRDGMTARGFVCVSGNADACEGAVLDQKNSNVPPEANHATLWSDGIVSTNQGLELLRDNSWFVTPRELGPRDWTILAEMVRTLGPDRFEKFWSSSQEPREAFNAAAGMTIGSWTRDWARRTYGEQSRGPGLAPSKAFLGVTFAMLAVTVAVGASRRRQVG
jgi:hypothetical protein